MNKKEAAGRAALAEVRSGSLLGLGTGSTIRYFLEALGEALAAGSLEDVRGVSTSIATEDACRALGIQTLPLAAGVRLDVAIDGADEVSGALDLIKGLGGALLREKMVVQAARRFVVIADTSKEVERLGTRAPLPVEVVRFGWQAHDAYFRGLGAEPEPRRDDAGELFVTDNGNHIVDLRFPNGISDPGALDRSLQRRAGVVENGLFLGVAERAYIGGPEGVSIRGVPAP